MKRIIYTLISLFLFTFCAFASDKEDVLKRFDDYVNDANSYSNNLDKYYVNNAKIIRVVNKKQGGRKSIVIPFERYLSELRANAKLAKTLGYKNKYINRNISKVDKDYKVSATRIPRNDKKGLPSHFIFTKVDNEWKIREESMTTNVQVFLNAK